MGLCASMSGGNAEEISRSKDIDKIMEATYKEEREKITFLLLGSGESGKSTIFKQMKILYGEPFSDEDLKHFKSVIQGNVINTMKTLCNEAYNRKLGSRVKNQDAFEIILNLHYMIEEIDDEICFCIEEVSFFFCFKHYNDDHKTSCGGTLPSRLCGRIELTCK